MRLQLSDTDRSFLDGDRGEGAALAMRVVTRVAEAMGAERLLDITGAHVDGCLYHGRAGLDFARRLRDGGARVTVPTTLNVGSLDLLHPELVRLSDPTPARELMETYVEMGCRPTWTCAPYQSEPRPRRGEQVAWAESNAVVFANSVLGARTERYGDFLDICAAITGRAPATGLHLDTGRRPRLVVDFSDVRRRFADEITFAVAGYLLGRLADDRVALLIGLPPDTDEDQLKALGAAAASSGSVGLFHAAGVTPEADAHGAGEALPRVRITEEMLAEAGRQLTTASGPPDAVSLGTPHYSRAQIAHLAGLLRGRTVRRPLYVSTSREVLDSLGAGDRRLLERAGVTVVTDTCTYVTPILEAWVRVVMTDSVKWAYYAPANLGVEVVFGSAEACVVAATEDRR